MSPQALLLDHLCKRYGQRPSNVMGLQDEILSYQFDMAIMARGFDNENEQMKRARGKGNPQAAMTALKEQLKDRTVDSDSIF